MENEKPKLLDLTDIITKSITQLNFTETAILNFANQDNNKDLEGACWILTTMDDLKIVVDGMSSIRAESEKSIPK